ncbi:hypothetical protein CPB86DRAFT_794033 [Serendipita vermifera]|nr:hypothetical protein CPB86DRAFT_794033 [Serendipita vermifera]
MERVQYSLESSLPELKDLQANGIFSSHEIKEIIKRRTNFEQQLVRRQPRKKDFLEYIEYEMALERLRKKRTERLKTPLPHSISSHSVLQRQFSIFERVTRKFKGDIRLWVQYIEVAKREGAGNLVSRVVAKALKLHPTSTALYVLAAQHELEQGSPSAARNILQQGIRLNNQNTDLWCEYVKMEISWCEILRRRWETLGISQDASPKDNSDTREMQNDLEATRMQVLNGAIVKEVLTNALRAFLYELLSKGPPLKGATPADIREIYSSRHFNIPNASGTQFVDALRNANKEMLEPCETDMEQVSLQMEGEEFQQYLSAYSRFVRKHWENLSDPNLRLYLLSSLSNLCKNLSNRVPLSPNAFGVEDLHATHLKILLDPRYPPPGPDKQKVLKLARRIESEKKYSLSIDTNSIGELVRIARNRVRGPGMEKIWVSGWEELSLTEQEDLLKEASCLTPHEDVTRLRETLLLRTFSCLYNSPSVKESGMTRSNTMGTRKQVVIRLLRLYSPTAVVYKHAFELEANIPTSDAEEKASLLEEIYRMWRDRSSEPGKGPAIEEAVFTYASYLLHSGSLKQAHIIINNLLASTPTGPLRTGLELRWKGIVEAPIVEDIQMGQERDDLDIAEDSNSHVESDDDYSLAISQ